MGGSLHIGRARAAKTRQGAPHGATNARMGGKEGLMAENEQLEAVQEETAEVEPQGETEAEIDWKAESRKWEKLAKRNKDAAAELDALKQSQLTEQEKLQQRAERAEAELSKLTAERERMQAAADVSAQSGIPQELLAFCSDRESMEQFAELYAKTTHTPSAPKTQQSRLVRESDTPISTRDLFAEMAANAFD